MKFDIDTVWPYVHGTQRISNSWLEFFDKVQQSHNTYILLDTMDDAFLTDMQVLSLDTARGKCQDWHNWKPNFLAERQDLWCPFHQQMSKEHCVNHKNLKLVHSVVPTKSSNVIYVFNRSLTKQWVCPHMAWRVISRWLIDVCHDSQME